MKYITKSFSYIQTVVELFYSISVDLLSIKYSMLKFEISGRGGIKSIFHGCMVWIEKSVTRVTGRHHEACRVMPNSDPE